MPKKNEKVSDLYVRIKNSQGSPIKCLASTTTPAFMTTLCDQHHKLHETLDQLLSGWS